MERSDSLREGEHGPLWTLAVVRYERCLAASFDRCFFAAKQVLCCFTDRLVCRDRAARVICVRIGFLRGCTVLRNRGNLFASMQGTWSVNRIGPQDECGLQLSMEGR